MSDSNPSSRSMGRSDLLSRPLPTAPPPAPSALGQAALHGPPRPSHLVVIVGVGPGMGLCIAQTFAALGYATALLSRDLKRLEGWAKELDLVARERLQRDGEEAVDERQPLSRAVYCDVLDPGSTSRALHDALQLFPERRLGTAVYNASVRVKRPLLSQTDVQVQDSFQASIHSPFVFLKECINFMKQGSSPHGGSILATGATSATRGREGFAAFSIGKTGLRRLCEVAAREHGKDKIHVAHVVIDGLIDSAAARKHLGLTSSEYFPADAVVDSREAAKAYTFLAQQGPSAWTFEMDLRPAKEKF